MNKEENNLCQNKNPLFDQIFAILAIKSYQICCKPMSPHYIYNFDCYKRIVAL